MCLFGQQFEDIHFILELQDETTSSSAQHLLQGTVFSKCPQILTCYVGYSFKENGGKLKRNLVCERHLTLRSSSNGVEIGVCFYCIPVLFLFFKFLLWVCGKKICLITYKQ